MRGGVQGECERTGWNLVLPEQLRVSKNTRVKIHYKESLEGRALFQHLWEKMRLTYNQSFCLHLWTYSLKTHFFPLLEYRYSCL